MFHVKHHYIANQSLMLFTKSNGQDCKMESSHLMIGTLPWM